MIMKVLDMRKIKGSQGVRYRTGVNAYTLHVTVSGLISSTVCSLIMTRIISTPWVTPSTFGPKQHHNLIPWHWNIYLICGNHQKRFLYFLITTLRHPSIKDIQQNMSWTIIPKFSKFWPRLWLWEPLYSP